MAFQSMVLAHLLIVVAQFVVPSILGAQKIQIPIAARFPSALLRPQLQFYQDTRVSETSFAMLEISDSWVEWSCAVAAKKSLYSVYWIYLQR